MNPPVDPFVVLDQRRRQLARIERLTLQYRRDLTPAGAVLMKHTARALSDDVQALTRAIRKA
jgi:hypothetical protein